MRKGVKIMLICLSALAVTALAGILLFNRYKWHITAWYLGAPQPGYAVTLESNVPVTMSDGVRLSADIYRPDAPGRFPVILTRTPYGKRNPEHRYAFAGGLFASQGFVFVVQDCRGKYDSDGEFYPYAYEGMDGYDTIEWAGTQSWSNGNVGTYGFSYWGSTQWLSAPYASRHLKAMVPIMASQNIYGRWIYNGIYRIMDVLAWHFENAPKSGRETEHIDWDKAVRHLPLIDADNALGSDIPSYNDWIRNPVPGKYWKPLNVDDRVGDIKAPALIIDGWYDYYLDLAVEDFARMRTTGGSPEARQSMLLLGPWTHNSKSKFDDADFGDEAGFMKRVAFIIRWFNYWLKGERNGILEEGPVISFMMGANEWRRYTEWPPKGVRPVTYYLRSNGVANTAKGTGALALDAPGAEKPDTYVYDPANPVPSIGGTSIYGDLKAGPYDQKAVEGRTDVLVYSTPPLEKDIEVAGPLKVSLFASSSARDTDFSAQVTDVRPDGTSVNVKAAVIRARYRDSLEKPSLLSPGKVYRFDIPVGNTAIVFRKGHRIRLQISSSNFPEYGRNTNTGAVIATDARTVTATQNVFHDRERPSRLVIPVISR